MKSHRKQVKSLHPFKLALSLCLIFRHCALLPRGKYSIWTRRTWLPSGFFLDGSARQAELNQLRMQQFRLLRRRKHYKVAFSEIYHQCKLLCLFAGLYVAGATASVVWTCHSMLFVLPSTQNTWRKHACFACSSVRLYCKPLKRHWWVISGNLSRSLPLDLILVLCFTKRDAVFVKTIPQPWHLDEFGFGAYKELAKI